VHARTRLDRVKGFLWRRDAFIDKYVFPDGSSFPLRPSSPARNKSGSSCATWKSARALRDDASALGEGSRVHTGEAIKIAGERIYRVWRLYMSAPSTDSRAAEPTSFRLACEAR
jgi:cyclopropane fatty-acyl-phospholipid synthase-like methyltransferase